MDGTNKSGTNAADRLKFDDLSDNKIFNALGGNDTLDIEGGTNNTYNLTSGYNTVNVKRGSGTIVNTGTDKDTVNVYNGSVSKINSASKTNADTIKITGGSIGYIELSAGSDKVVANGGTITSLSLGNGYNTVFVSGGNVNRIQGGNTNDTITVSAGETTTVVGTDSRQKLTVKGSGKVGEADLRGGSDIVSLENNATVGVLRMGSGDNYTYIYDNAQVTGTIYGGTGVDRLRLDSGSIKNIAGGSGVQRLTIDGGTVGNINVGSGDDLVSVTGGTVQNITLSSGNNQAYIYGGRVNGTITGGTGSDKIKVVSGTVEKITGSTGAIYVTLEKDAVVNGLNGGSGADTFVIRNSNQTLNSGAGADKIYIYGNGNYNVNGGAGNDVITVNGSSKGTITGGTGSDSYNITWNDGMNLIINNSDFTQGDGDIFTIIGKTKNDFNISFNNYNNVLTLSEKNGKGSIKINLAKGLDATDNFSGITFGKTFVSKGELVSSEPQKTVSAQTVIKSFMQALDATDKIGLSALDVAIQSSSYGRYANFADLVQEFKTACLTHGGTNVTENMQFLWDYCNVDMLNEDSGAISGADAKGLAGTGVEINEKDIVPEPAGMTAADLTYNYSEFGRITAKDVSVIVTASPGTYFYESSFVNKTFYSYEVDGVVLYWDESNWSNLCSTYNIDRSVLKQLVAGVIKAWADPSMKLILDSYGMSMTEKGSLSYTINGKPAMQLFLKDDTDSNLATVHHITSPGGNGEYEVMSINLRYFHDAITDINGNSSSPNGDFLDNVIAHEMVHAVMCATIPGFSSLPKFMIEGLADLIVGIDNKRSLDIYGIPNQDKIWNPGNASASYNQKAMLDNLFDLKDMDARWGNTTYAAGYLLMRYFAKQVDSYVNKDDISAAHGNAIYIGQEKVEEAVGGIATIGNVYNNRVYVTNRHTSYSSGEQIIENGAADEVYGGITQQGDVYSNTVSVKGFATPTVGTLYGGFSENGNIFNNLIKCVWVFNRDCIAFAGYTKNGDVYGNEFSFEGTSINVNIQDTWKYFPPSWSGNSYCEDLYGGFSEVGTVRDNKLMVKYTAVGGEVYGAYALDGIAQGNKLSLTNIYSEYANAAYVKKGDAKRNSVDFAGGYVKELYGAVVDNGNAANNSIEIASAEKGSYVVRAMGAKITGTGSASYNSVNIKKPVAGQQLSANVIYGAYANTSGNVLQNTVVVNGGNIGNVYGAYSGTGSATGNEVYIQGDTVIDENVYAAVTNGKAADNMVAVLGHASVKGSVLGSNGSDIIIVRNNSGVSVNGNLGQDIFAFDLSANSGSSILDTDSNNVLKLINTDISSVSIRKNGSSLTITKNGNVLNINNASSISSIDFISSSSATRKSTFNLAGAVSSLRDSALSFSDSSLVGFFNNNVVLNDQDKKIFIAASGKTV